MPALEFEHFVAKERSGVERREEVVLGVVIQAGAAKQEPRFKIGCGDGDVFAGFDGEFGAGSDRCAHRESELPQSGKKGREVFCEYRIFASFIFKEHQQINIGIGKELSSSESAHCFDG